MSDAETITAEGETLSEATKNAAEALGVRVNEVEFEYDRDHLASGASTIRIFAKKRDPMTPRPKRKPDRRPHRDENIKARGREAIDEVLAGAEQAVVVDLNSYERRLIHMLVRESGHGLTTTSEGDGLRKNVIVTRGDPDAEDGSAPEEAASGE